MAIFAPIFTGYLLEAGWASQIAYKFFGGVLAVAGVATLLLDRTCRGRTENPEAPELESLVDARAA